MIEENQEKSKVEYYSLVPEESLTDNQKRFLRGNITWEEAYFIRSWQVRWLQEKQWVATPQEIREATSEVIGKHGFDLINK